MRVSGRFLAALLGGAALALGPTMHAAPPGAGPSVDAILLTEVLALSRREVELEGRIRADVLETLRLAGLRVDDRPSLNIRSALQEKGSGAVLAVRYSRGTEGLAIFGHVLSASRGVLVDAFAIRDDLAAVGAEVPGLGEKTPDSLLVRRFARTLAFRIRSNPELRPRLEQIAEAQRERIITPEMRLPLPTMRSADGTAGALSIFREQEVRSATLSPRPLPEIPATVRVITAEDIRRRGYRYLHELLRDLPGFDVTFQQGLYGSIFAQRGLDQPENLRTLVLIDGIPDNNISQGSAYIKHTYALHAVKQVEVVYGPASALYGANAFTGLVNIVTRDGADVRNFLELGGGTTYMEPDGRRPARSAFATFGRKFGEDSIAPDLLVYGHWIDGDGPILNRRDNVDPLKASYTWTDGYTASELKDNYAAGFKFQWKYLTVSSRATKDFTGQGTFASERAYADDADLAFWHVRTYSSSARVELPLGSRVTERLRVTYRDTSVVDGTDADYDRPGQRLGSITVTRYRRPDREVSIDNPLSIRWTRTQETVVGFTYTDQNAWNYNTRSATYPNRYVLEATALPVRPDADPLNKFKYTDRAGYLEHTARPFDDLILTVGYRYDVFRITGAEGARFCGTTEGTLPSLLPNPYFVTANEAASRGCVLRGGGQYYEPRVAEKYYDASNPRLGLVYRITPRISSRFLYGAAFRAPTVRELYSVSSSRTSNGALEPETIRTAEAGLSAAPSKRILFDAAVFHSYVRDMILLAGTDIHRPGRSEGSNLSRFQNAGRAQADGAELTADAALRGTWRFYLGYTYQRSRLFDVSEPGLTAHDARRDFPILDNVTACRALLERNGLGPLRSECGGYSGDMPRVARHKLQAGSYIEPIARLILDVRGTWVDRRMNIATNPNRSVPSYFLLNVSFGSRDWPVDGLDFRVRVENALDAEILDPGFRDGNGSYFPAAHPQPRRWIGWELSYRL